MRIYVSAYCLPHSKIVESTAINGVSEQIRSNDLQEKGLFLGLGNQPRISNALGITDVHEGR